MTALRGVYCPHCDRELFPPDYRCEECGDKQHRGLVLDQVVKNKKRVFQAKQKELDERAESARLRSDAQMAHAQNRRDDLVRSFEQTAGIWRRVWYAVTKKPNTAKVKWALQKERASQPPSEPSS